MKFSKRIKTYKFWVALSAALILFVQTIGDALNFEIDAETINSVIMAFCGVLVVCGFVTKDEDIDSTDTNEEENDDDEDTN